MYMDRIAILRASLTPPRLEETCVRIPLGHEAADRCLKGGLQRGALHEVFAMAGHEASATGFVSGLAQLAAGGKHLLWICADFSSREFGSLSATGLLEFGFDPSRLLLLRVAKDKDALRAAIDALSCPALGAVIIEICGKSRILDLQASRRLTLACERKAVTGFLLRFGVKPQASTAETRWFISAAVSRQGENWGYPVFETDLVRNRNGRTGQWVMEWNNDARLFQKPAQDTGLVVSAASHRQATAA
jgi:protein ImuA